MCGRLHRPEKSMQCIHVGHFSPEATVQNAKCRLVLKIHKKSHNTNPHRRINVTVREIFGCKMSNSYLILAELFSDEVMVLQCFQSPLINYKNMHFYL